MSPIPGSSSSTAQKLAAERLGGLHRALCVSAGLLAEGPDALRDRLRARLAPLLTETGYAEILDRPLPWDRWDPTARQLRG